MADSDDRKEQVPETANTSQERIDQDLEIMEQHAQELAQVEEGIKESMRKRDREYKDARLHSVPKPKKHSR